MSLPRYLEYKDSGVEWLGEIPAHWHSISLKRLVQPLRPITYGIVQAGPNEGADGVPYIRPTDMTDEAGVKDLGGLLRTTQQIAGIYARSSIQSGDIVCSIGPSFGKVMITPDELTGANLTQGTARISIAPGAIARFVFWALRSSSSMAQWDVSVGGATFRALNLEPLAETLLAMPGVEEQQGIANFLDRETAKIDALIAEQEKLLALLAEKRLATISHAVTRGLNPSVPMKDCGTPWLGEVPAHWGVCALSYLCSIETGATPDRGEPRYWNGSIPWLKTGEINWDPISETEEFISEDGLANSAAKISRPGTLLMAMYGQGVTRGRVAILEIAAAYNQACAAISFGSRILPEYARYFFMAAYEHIREGGNETSQMNLSAGLIAKVRLTVPPTDEQAGIVRFLNSRIFKLEVLCMEVTRAIRLLGERRSGLIAAAATGKIDVRGLAASPSETLTRVAS